MPPTPHFNRYPVKLIRDRVKSNYKKGFQCEICDTTELLELHHYNSLSAMYPKWCKDNNESPEDIIEHRDQFIEDKYTELVDLCSTLCKEHHARLHKIYGKTPKLGTAAKQPGWVLKQREKLGLPPRITEK